MAEPLLEAFVAGRPAPKGSVRVMPNGYVKQQSEGAKPFEAAVADACRPLAADLPGRPGGWVARDGFPLDEPVSVDLTFFFDRPKRSAFDAPATVQTGDIDKLTRCVLDGLTRGGVYVDDARVVKLIVETLYAEEGESAGVKIIVSRWSK